MKNTLILILIFLGGSSTIFSQNASEALRYSFLERGGTARTAGLGGAIGALGADFSVMSTNPAGLAVYRGSEFTLTPTFVLGTTKSRLVNSEAGDSTINQLRFNFNNLGLVFAKPRGGKLKTFNVGFGFNRLANYNQVFAYRGQTVGSYVDRFVELATDNNQNPIFPDDLDNFEAGLAYEAGAIFDPDDTDGIPMWGSDFGGDPEVFKKQRVRTKGSLNEIVFGMAGNYDEKLFIGGSLGIHILNYSERKTYWEEDTGGGKDGDIPFFNDLRFVEDLETNGVGINLKLGVIYRFSQAFRMGLAFHTPTAYSMDDAFYTEFEYSFAGADGQEVRTEAVSPNGSFDYGLRTPLRVLTSAGFIIKKSGFITAEVEWLDYSSSRFNLTKNSSSEADALYEREVNQDIQDQFQSAVNVRVGGEFAHNVMRYRIGTGLQTTPYAEGSILSNYFTGGVGYRGESFYTDLAYTLSFQEEGYVPYLLDELPDGSLNPKQQLVNNELINQRLMLTLGFRF